MTTTDATAGFALRGRNPDVLTCIANLSSDEVFTPPDFANKMLDTLADAWADANDGADIWSNPDVTFLDPVTKSGVFLREITTRLTRGLAAELPGLQERVDHILTKQVFGIGTTHLTSLMARRSVYCSKYANGEHSVAKAFDTDSGNVWFERTEHTWDGDRCRYCGASRQAWDRGPDLETHAYAFIHTEDIKVRVAELFGGKMQFDVIIGNPPYQLEGGGGGSNASSIYQRFVHAAKSLDPKLLSLVIPARWYAGGRGLDDFRADMLSDNRLRVLHDWPDSSTVFPGLEIKGGVCYFLWDRDRPGECSVVSHLPDGAVTVAERPLLEEGLDVFVRFNQALPILRKVVRAEKSHLDFAELVSGDTPFGLATNFAGSSKSGVLVYGRNGTSRIPRVDLRKNRAAIDKWKVYISKAYGAGETYPHQILGVPFVGEPGSVCTQTYLYVGPFDTESEARHVVSYLACRFTRFLVLLHKPTQDAMKAVYSFVPSQDFSEPWTDQKLYERYGITDDEVAFIDSMVRPMTVSVSSKNSAK